MGADYIGYSLIMPTDPKLYKPVIKEQIKKVEAALALAGGKDKFEKASPKDLEKAIDALTKLDCEIDNLVDGYDSTEVLNIVAGELETARKFTMESYEDLRTAGWQAHEINGVEVAFLNAGDMSWGDDPADLDNEACRILRAMGRVGMYKALNAAVPWGKKYGGLAKRGADVVESLLNARGGDEAHDIIVNHTDELEALVNIVRGK